MEMAGRSLPLEYHHEPGSARDGVTLTVPLVALNQVDAARCDWLVPGLEREKVTRLAKSLPQKLRHKLGPLPELADAFLAAGEAHDTPLAEAIARWARRELNLAVPMDAFRAETLPAHLSMNFRVVDEHGRQLAMGRSLAQLRSELGERAGEVFSQLAQPAAEGEKHTGWEFGELEDVMEIRRGPQTLIGYPALVDRGDGVSLEVLDSPEKAREQHRAGLRRLFMLELKEQVRYLEKSLPGLQALALQFTPFGDAADLKLELLAATFDRACMHEPWPRSAAEFARRRDEARSRVSLIAQEIARLAATILAEHAALRKKLQQTAKAFPDASRDVEAAVGRLLTKRFIEQMPYERLRHFPRYLKAASLRLDKLRANPERDARSAAEIAPLQQQWLREQAKRGGARDPLLEQFRWLLEELRVQLFAQELRTPVPVSAKRLAKMWQTIER
jgi:ATP-dependent helicase HrpA